MSALRVQLTPDQYNKLSTALSQSGEVALTFTDEAKHSGDLDTDKVDLNFTYDGTANMLVGIKKKKGLAHFASDNEVYGHVVPMLSSFLGETVQSSIS